MNALEWELKSPIGNSKTTVVNNIENAKTQSSNIVFDSRRTSITDSNIKRILLQQFKLHKSIRHILLITKEKLV
jgi:hypothetical protein